MTFKEIIQHIDNSANHYISLFGEAAHMERINKEFYSYVKPKLGEQGMSIIYNVRIDDLPPEQMKAVVDEMKSMNMPVWFSLLASDEASRAFFGSIPNRDNTDPDENDEIYMAMLPENRGRREYHEINDKLIRVRSAEEFALWAETTNGIFSDGYPNIHPVNHFNWVKSGAKCYILYHDDIPASVAAVMDNGVAASLEFVGTVPEMRKRGLAGTVCERAVSDAFADGAFIITLRASNRAAARIYQALGFKAYNQNGSFEV